MKPVIDVRGISKSYQISHLNSSSYGTLKDDFSNLIKKPFGGGESNEQETFWALKDINFQVNQGETFGVIGKNGSGKSTLLKILSRIVDPTSGSIKIHGKVASLLEVGTGFHPELTGRENIYFNGSIIGMSKQEITRKFDEIVDFSGVEKFLDTPVKFYSSGMFVRLAFSVAANLDSEILILDEVLSVGDVEFQKKSLNKMLSIAKEGRTILFVSHSMSSIQDICSKAMLLHKGKVKFIGSSDAVADRYLRENMPVQKPLLGVEKKKQRTKVSLIGRKDRQGSGKIIFNEITDIKWDPEARKMNLAMTYDNVEGVSINNAKISVALRDTESNLMLCNITNDVLNQRIDLSEGGGTISLEIYDVNLETGEYNIELFMASDLQNGEILDWVNRAAKIEINNDRFYSTGHVPPTRDVVLFNFKYATK